MSVERKDYPQCVWLERDEETNEKRWFTVPGMGVEYALATRPEREAQEAVAWRAVAHPETGMGTMVNQIKYRLAEDADSLYGKGRWTLEELVPRNTPPDAAVTIARLEKERDEACARARANARAVGRKALVKLNGWLTQWRNRALAAEAEAARLREAVLSTAASLAASISILERTPKAKKAAPSDRMFDTMLSDYRNALDAARAALDQPARFTVNGAECMVVPVEPTPEMCSAGAEDDSEKMTFSYGGDENSFYYLSHGNARDIYLDMLRACEEKQDGREADHMGEEAGEP